MRAASGSASIGPLLASVAVLTSVALAAAAPVRGAPSTPHPGGAAPMATAARSAARRTLRDTLFQATYPASWRARITHPRIAGFTITEYSLSSTAPLNADGIPPAGGTGLSIYLYPKRLATRMLRLSSNLGAAAVQLILLGVVGIPSQAHYVTEIQPLRVATLGGLPAARITYLYEYADDYNLNLQDDVVALHAAHDRAGRARHGSGSARAGRVGLRRPAAGVAVAAWSGGDGAMSMPPDDREPAGAAAQHEHGSAYRQAGVDYTTLDAGKRLALARALDTSPFIAARGGTANDASRGEPAFVFELDGRYFAFVVEGLGTKSIIARQVAETLGVNRFADVAYDTVAAIVNDLCCVGALPLVVNAYFATGSADWYRREDWQAELLEGWYRACADAGATWGGGESPSLPELVDARDIELAGSAIGALPAGAEPILGDALAAGDEIVIVASSGLHANGSSLARLVASRLPDGYATPLASGRRFGEALLDPSRAVRAPGRAPGRRGTAGHLPQPHHRPRAAEADAPGQGAHL